MLPISNQPAQFYGTAKTYMFDDVNNIAAESLELRQVIAHTGTYMYKSFQSI